MRIKKILEVKPQILKKAVDHIGQTALHWAAKRGFKKLLEILLSKGADMSSTDLNGKTALDVAIQHN